MKTITLFSAAILAAGTATSPAQTNVYSENVYGYINLNLCTGFNLVADQLNLAGASSNNTVHSVFGTSLPGGTAVYAYSAGAFASPPASYSTKGGWTGNTNAVNAGLKPGRGVFIQVPSPATISFVGDVSQGTLSVPYGIGYNIISSPVPVRGAIQLDLGYSPFSGDVVYRFPRCGSPGSGYQPYSYSTKGGWQTNQPILEVGEAVFLQAKSCIVGNAWFHHLRTKDSTRVCAESAQTNLAFPPRLPKFRVRLTRQIAQA